MNAIIDANVLAAYFLEEGERNLRARRLLDSDIKWNAPRLWRSEFLNVLRSYVRWRELPLVAALTSQYEAEDQIRPLPDPEAQHVLELAGQSECSSYDCEYVATAMTFDMPLYTFDKKLIAAFPEIAREP